MYTDHLFYKISILLFWFDMLWWKLKMSVEIDRAWFSGVGFGDDVVDGKPTIFFIEYLHSNQSSIQACM